MKRPDLNRKLTLEGPYRTRDDTGGYMTTWSVLGTLWASVKAGTGRADDLAGLSGSPVRYKITVRAAPYGAPSRPRAGQRFKDGDRRFQILAVTEADGDARYLTCVAREDEVTA